MMESTSHFVPLAVYMSADNGEWVVRDYAGQSGRFCVIGPYTTDILSSHKTIAAAKDRIEWRAGPGGQWQEEWLT